MKSQELYDLLPNDIFYVESTLNNIRQYDPHKRAPTAKYPLYEVLDAWYKLVCEKRIFVRHDVASKKDII